MISGKYLGAIIVEERVLRPGVVLDDHVPACRDDVGGQSGNHRTGMCFIGLGLVNQYLLVAVSRPVGVIVGPRCCWVESDRRRNVIADGTGEERQTTAHAESNNAHV